MDLNTTSRIFIDVSSKLLILSKAERVGKGTYTVSELVELSKEKDKEGYCVMLRPRDVGGYVLACGGQLIAIALLNPPSIGKKALENVDENPLFGDLYLVPKDAVKEALRKLKAEEAVSGLGEQIGKAIQIVKDKLASKGKEEAKKEEEMIEEIELPESISEVPKLEIFDMIDAVTLADELAYYMSKRGYVISSDTPDMVGNTFVVTLKAEDVPELSQFLKDLIEEAKRVNCENIIKVNIGSKEIFVDPILFDKIRSIVNNLTRGGGYCYMEPHGPEEVVLKVNLNEEISAKALALLRAHIRKMIEQRRLPWKKVVVVVNTPTTSYHEVA